MPNVALRGVPEPVHRRLKDAARANHRSMNGEILARLAASVSAEPATSPATTEEIRNGAQGVATNDAGVAPRSAGAPMPVVAIPYEPLSEEELLEPSCGARPTRPSRPRRSRSAAGRGQRTRPRLR